MVEKIIIVTIRRRRMITKNFCEYGHLDSELSEVIWFFVVFKLMTKSLCTIKSYWHSQFTGSGQQDNKLSSRGCSGFEKNIYASLLYSGFLAYHLNSNTCV